MKKIIQIISICLVFSFVFSIAALATDYKYNTVEKGSQDISELELYPGGMAFGVKMMTKGLTVVKLASKSSPAARAGLTAGDIIIKVNGNEINSIEDFSKIVNKYGSKPLTVTVIRNKKELNFKLQAEYSKEDDSYKTGIWIKDSTAGIGTVTFINPETSEFAGLGHGVCSANGDIIPFTKGAVLDVSINGVVKGKCGAAGELKGEFNTKKIGTLTKNSAQGVFGVLAEGTYEPPQEKVKVCLKEDVCEGEAYIWCTLDGGKPQKYSVSIFDIDKSNTTTKSFKIKITDKRLIDKTGGIVQGMSGSPIIQNGKLVGAVTHVLINDPTQGYGIFIENMLSAS